MSQDYLFDLDILRDIRKRHGTTQAQIADKIGMTRESWNRIEHGQRRLDSDYLPALCDALDCSCAELISGYGQLFRDPGEHEPVFMIEIDGHAESLSSDEYAMLRMAARFAGTGMSDPELLRSVMMLIRLRRNKNHENGGL